MRASRDCGSIIYHSFIFKPVPINCIGVYCSMGFPGGSDGKASACSAGDTGSIPGLERSLEKEMATHSSILAWKIPWTEEPGGLQSLGSQRVGHDWATSLFHILLYVWCSPRKLFHPGKILDWKITQFVGWMIAESQDICCSVSFTSKGWVPLLIHSTNPACFQTYTSNWLLDNPALQAPYLQSWTHHLSFLFYFCFLT